MKLRDFELGISSFDKENVGFNMRVRCLLAHFFNYYKDQDTARVKKIVIELEPIGVDFYSDSKHPMSEYENLQGIAMLRKEFDFKKYWKLSEIEKSKYALSAFIEGIKDVCARENIDSSRFDKISDQIVRDEYIYQRHWKKRAISSPLKKIKANIFFKYLADKIEIYAEIHSDGNDLQRVLIEEISPPYLREFNNAFGRLYWDSDSMLVFMHKDEAKKIKIDVTEI